MNESVAFWCSIEAFFNAVFAADFFLLITLPKAASGTDEHVKFVKTSSLNLILLFFLHDLDIHLF